MATVLEYMVALKNWKRITCFNGFTQSDSIEQYLQKRKVSHFIEELTPTKVANTVLGDINCGEILEKHSILDVMMHGASIIDTLGELSFKTTYNMINLYGDPQNIDS